MATTVVEVKPLVLKNYDFIILTKDYKKHLDQVTFTPSASPITWTGAGQNTHTDMSTATWVCTVGYAQDWETAGSLSQLLYDSEGQTLDVIFRPKSGVGKEVAAKLIATPGSIGGSIGSFGNTTVTLGCAEKPKIQALTAGV